MKSGELAAKLRGSLATLDPDTLTDEQVGGLLSMTGAGDTGTPERMAEINEILNALPVRLRERLLTEYLNRLMRLHEKP
jgi:hypothetical protein